jgi:hypothetical protein
MKSVRVIIALTFAVAAFSIGALGGCADYSLHPTGELLAPPVDPAVAHSRNKILVSVNPLQDRTGRLSFGPFGLDDVSALAEALKTSSGGRTYALVASEDLRAGGRSPELILDGAVTGFEASVVMGGSPAGVLGVGASTPYWRVAVAVELRAADARTGAGARMVSVQDTIYAVALSDGGVRYVAPDAGRIARKSPSVEAAQDMAVRRAIQKAVRKLMTPDLVRPEHVAASAGRHRARVSRKVASKGVVKSKGVVNKEKVKEETLADLIKVAPEPTGAAPVASTPTPPPTPTPTPTPTSSTPPGDDAPKATSAIPWLSNMQAFGVVH